MNERDIPVISKTALTRRKRGAAVSLGRVNSWTAGNQQKGESTTYLLKNSSDLGHTYKCSHQFDLSIHYCLEGKAIKHVEALSIIKWIFPITRKLNATLTLSWKLIPSISINQFLLRADFNHYLWQFRVFNIWSGNVHSTNQFLQANILVFRC